MKLILCKNCHDVVRLWPDYRTCLCGMSGGRYTDEINAVITGEALPLGFANPTFYDALRNYTELKVKDMGFEFTAFIIPDNARSVRHET